MTVDALLAQLVIPRKLLKEFFWWPVTQVTSGFHLLPPLAAIILFLLLIRFGQMREIYIFYLEQFDAIGTRGLLQLLWAALAFSLLSAALLISHYALSPMRSEILFQGPTEPYSGSNLNWLQKSSAIALSLIPWAGLIVGLYLASEELGEIQSVFRQMVSPFGTALHETDRISAMGRLQERAWTAMVITGLFGAATAIVLHLCGRSRYRRRWWRTIRLATLVALAIVGLVPIINAPYAIELYRTLGPLATTALSFLFFFSVFALLAYYSKAVFTGGNGFPAVTLAVLAVCVGGYFGVSTGTMAKWLCYISLILVVLAWFLRLNEPVAVLVGIIFFVAVCTVSREGLLAEGKTFAGKADERTVEERFEQWFRARLDRGRWNKDESTRYPVFIIAVQGGGIYAAAAASAFLAGLQDRCPHFAQHVFAISAVSGGAIAATLFQSHLKSLPQVEPRHCQQLQDDREPLAKRLTKIMLDDHFSPVVASIIPDFIGLPWDRAVGLKNSFIASTQPPAGTVPGILAGEFANHWDESAAAPALVLNTTWAETGYRVAFAPFAWKGDDTAYQFSDSRMLGGTTPAVALMEAAAISARFPGILPPYAVLKPRRAGGTQRWNFVDGGYSDPSGAATALEIYRVLERMREHHRFDLKLILLTGAHIERDFENIDGTSFRDVVAPIDAVLKVRTVLAGQSVARVKDYFKEHPGWLRVIVLQDQLFRLPLGWTISKTTHGLVSLLVGRPDLCVPVDAEPSQVLQQNSCFVKEIEALLLPPER